MVYNESATIVVTISADKAAGRKCGHGRCGVYTSAEVKYLQTRGNLRDVGCMGGGRLKTPRNERISRNEEMKRKVTSLIAAL
jgi:hypothetical protein